MRHMFYVDAINGQEVDNARLATARASYGQGMSIKGKNFERVVAVSENTLTLNADVYHAAPISALFNAGSDYSISGTIKFTPTANQRYFVKGLLSENYQGIWLEDSNGRLASRRIEKGDYHAALKQIEQNKTYASAKNKKATDNPAALRTLLSNAKPSELQSFAKDFYKNGTRNKVNLDLIAQRIWDGRNSVDGQEVDALAWFCKAFVHSEQGRYYNVLNAVANHAKSRKLRKHAKVALKSLPSRTADQFQFRR